MMFFKNVPGAIDFQPYKIYHFLVLAVLFLLALLIFVFKNKLRDNKKIDLRVRIIATVIAFSLEAGYHISNLVYHTDFAINLIPLELCAMSLWLSFILNIWKNERVFK